MGAGAGKSRLFAPNLHNPHEQRVRSMTTSCAVGRTIPGTSAGDGPTMGYTQWLLVQHSDLTFRFVSERRYVDFWNGRGPLPQAHPGEVRTIEVVLHLEERRAGEVIHVEHHQFPVLATGRRDRASMESEMALIRDIVGSNSSTRPNLARRRWATRQIDRTFQ
jgi:hypothetical protein